MKRILTDLSVEAIMLNFGQLERTAYRWKALGIPLSKYKKFTETKLLNSVIDKNLVSTVKITKMTKSSKNDNVKSTVNLTDKIDYLTDKVEHLESLLKSLVLEIKNIKATDKNTDIFPVISTVKEEGLGGVLEDFNTNKELVINTKTNSNTNKQEIIIDTYTMTKTKNDNVNLVNCQTVKNSNLTKSSNIKKTQSNNPIQKMIDKGIITEEEFYLFKNHVVNRYPFTTNTSRFDTAVKTFAEYTEEEKQECVDSMDLVISHYKGKDGQYVKNFLSFLKEKQWQVIKFDALKGNNKNDELLEMFKDQLGVY